MNEEPTEMNAHRGQAPRTVMISAQDRAAARRRLGAAPLFCALLLSACSLLALTSAPALADARIGTSGFPAALHAGGVDSPQGLAVSAREGGDIYVVNAGSDQRVDQFTPAGGFVRAFGAGVVPGAASGSGDLTAGSATVTDVDTTAGAFMYGELITGPGIPPGTTIADDFDGEFNGTGTLTLSNAATASATGVPLSVAAGPGNVPTNERQRVTLEATGGQFTLAFTSPQPSLATESTATIPFNATAAEVQAALEALADLGPGNVTVSLASGGNAGGEPGAPGGPWNVEFGGSRYADTNVEPLTPESTALSGGAHEATVLTVQPGAQALETCTSLCRRGGEACFSTNCSRGPGGPGPGDLNYADEIAVDNDPSSSSYGDVYVVDQRNFRVQKFGPSGEFLLMFGGEVDKGPHHPGNLCTAAYLAEGDICGAGVPGDGSGFFEQISNRQSWGVGSSNAIAIGPDGTVYVGDFRRVQEFESDGTYKGQLSLPEAQFVSSLAVDASGHVYANSRAVGEKQFVHLPSSGNFTLTFEEQTTAPIETNGNEGEVQAAIKAALEALPKVGHGNVEVRFERHDGFPEIAEVTFVRSLGDANVPQLKTSAGPVETLIEGAAGELVELGPSSEVLQAFDTEPGSEPTHIALDEEGDLFVSDLDGQVEDPATASVQFRAFKPDGSLYAALTSGEAPVAQAIALGNGHVYAATTFGFFHGSEYVAVLGVPVKGPPTVSAERATDVEPTTTTLNAIVNPEQFDTTYRFQYVTEAHFEAEGFANPEQTVPVDLGAISEDYPVQTAISGLAPATAYRWRVLAENECNGPSPEPVCEAHPESTFETLPGVSVRDFSTLTVAPELVIIQAELANNNSLQGARWEICYGTEAGSYTAGCVEGTLPAGSSSFEAVKATFTGLKPNSTYHYQLTAENEYTAPGQPEETADATFTTEPSAAEDHQAELAACPNVGLREEDNSTALPDCRAYEQVSPAFKNAYPASISEFLAPSGERDYFGSVGSFSGSEQNRGFGYYFAQRTPQGWVTRSPVGPPAGPDAQPSLPLDFSAALDTAVFTSLPGSNSIAAGLPGSGSPTLYYTAPDGSYLPASPTLTPVDPTAAHTNFEIAGASSDLSRVVIGTDHKLLASDPLPDSESGRTDRLYELSGVGGPEPTLSLAAEVSTSLPKGCELDDSQGGAFGQAANPLSADGSTLFYEAPLAISPSAPCGAGSPNKYALFARAGDGPAVEVSSPSPSCLPCAAAATQNAHFYGSSPDGGLAWFTTTQPLVSSDTDPAEANDLYLARLEEGGLSELVQASEGDATDPARGEGAGVQGVVRISQNGEVAAFVATGVLTTAPDPTTGQSATQGADNLYVYDAASGTTKFVAELCSGPEASAAAADPACPASLNAVNQGPETHNDGRLWTTFEGNEQGVSEAHLTPDGRDLLLVSYGRLTAGDTDNTKDVYRYDLSTGQLIRVSIGRDGNDGNGNGNYDAKIGSLHENWHAYLQAEDAERSISADGSEVIFETAAPLVSHDTNLGARPGCGEEEATGCDVYEWQESGHGACQEAGGCIRLISSGVDPHSISGAVISSSGRDIAFVTPRAMVPGDSDGVADVYDAREDGGFRPARSQPPCAGVEDCHGPGSTESAPPKITTESPTGGNGAQQLNCAKGRHKVKKHGQTRCVPNMHKKKRHKSHDRRSHKRAGHNGGGAK